VAEPVPTREELRSRVSRVLNWGGFGNPDVLLVAHEGREAVLKDYAPRSWWVRNTVGRVITALEARAWRALEGHPNVPRFLARVDALALLVEYRPGTKLSERRAVPPAFLDELERAIDGMHERGVVHLDLSHRSNVLVDEAGHPVLIDFGSSFWLRPGSLLARCLLPWLRRVDRRALAKWKRKLFSAEAAPG
jgi:serine/threonine protein kinase